MQVQFEISEKMRRAIIGVAAVLISLVLGLFVTTSPDFEQVLLAILACVIGLIGMGCLVGAIFNTNTW